MLSLKGLRRTGVFFGATFRNAGLASYPCVEEIISATSKKDEIGHRIDIIELFG